MIISLITQLLRQHQCEIGHLEKQKNAALIEGGDLREMTMLFRSLVLPLRILHFFVSLTE